MSLFGDSDGGSKSSFESDDENATETSELELSVVQLSPNLYMLNLVLFSSTLSIRYTTFMNFN